MTAWHQISELGAPSAAWKRFVIRFVALFYGGTLATYLFVLIMDPYGISPLAVPMDRPMVSVSQRHMYPLLIRSHRYDSFIVGSSTSMLLDPDLLNGPLQAKFANLAMADARAWEQREVARFFIEKVGEPKVLLVGLDRVWCDQNPGGGRAAFRRFPWWLYDENPLNAYPYLLNWETVELAGRLVGYQLGRYPERIRRDGYVVFVHPDETHDLAQARKDIWQGLNPEAWGGAASAEQTNAPDASSVSFPALEWLDELLAKAPNSTKLLVYMPVHIAAQPAPRSIEARHENVCKQRIAAIARTRGTKVIDWRIPSRLTENDSNYWDALHYRLPVAQHIARETANAAATGAASADGTYRIVVP